MSHSIRCLKVNGNDMLSRQSAAYQCVCERVLRRKAEPQIAFNWRLELSDSLRLSCQSRRSHHGDASQHSALLTTSGNGWLWRAARERVDGHTDEWDDRDTGRETQTYLQTEAGRHTHTGQKGEALKGIRVEACWRGRLFCKTDVPQWAQALDNLITATGTEQGTYRRDKALLSDCHLDMRTKQLKLSLKIKVGKQAQGKRMAEAIQGRGKGGGIARTISRILCDMSQFLRKKIRLQLLFCAFLRESWTASARDAGKYTCAFWRRGFGKSGR